VLDATGAFYFTTRTGGIYRLVLDEPRALIWPIPEGRWGVGTSTWWAGWARRRL